MESGGVLPKVGTEAGGETKNSGAESSAAPGIKITIHPLGKESVVFTLADMNPTIGEFRQAIARQLQGAWDHFVLNIKDRLGKQLFSICLDDDPNQSVMELIRRKLQDQEVVVNELRVYAVMALGKGFRVTKHNPNGYSPELGLQTEPANKFFQAAMAPDDTATFSERLRSIGVAAESVPKEFQDPYSQIIMNNPVITPAQRVCDLASFEETVAAYEVLHGPLPPAARRDPVPNLRLRSAMEEYVAEQELICAAALEQKSAGPAFHLIPTPVAPSKSNVETEEGAPALPACITQAVDTIWTFGAFGDYIRNEARLKSFSQRLQKIEVADERVPEEFRDGLTDKCMNDPVITPTRTICDAQTLEEVNNTFLFLNGALPEGQRPEVAQPAPWIRSKIEAFVVGMEYEMLGLATQEYQRLEGLAAAARAAEKANMAARRANAGHAVFAGLGASQPSVAGAFGASSSSSGSSSAPSSGASFTPEMTGPGGP